jgi:hypothetical protein
MNILEIYRKMWDLKLNLPPTKANRKRYNGLEYLWLKHRASQRPVYNRSPNKQTFDDWYAARFLE